VSAGARVAVVLAIVAGAGAIALGAADRLLDVAAAWEAPATGLDFGSLTATLAPDLAAMPALRVVLLYAFAQALHYIVWLALIPRLATPRRSLRQDLGTLPLALAGAVSLAVPLAGWAAPGRVRAIYLSLVLFHGWLELAVIAHLWARGRLRAGVA